jgi:hypothetical protein
MLHAAVPLVQKRLAQGGGELGPQTQAGLPVLKLREQFPPCHQAFGRLPGPLVAFVAAPPDQLARQQPWIRLERHAATIAFVQPWQVQACFQRRHG